MKFSVVLIIIGLLCFLFAVIDFCGMFFHYDLTGISFSPMIAGFIGSGLMKWAESLEKEGK
jgi:hypothetical protein